MCVRRMRIRASDEAYINSCIEIDGRLIFDCFMTELRFDVFIPQTLLALRGSGACIRPVLKTRGKTKNPWFAGAVRAFFFVSGAGWSARPMGARITSPNGC